MKSWGHLLLISLLSSNAAFASSEVWTNSSIDSDWGEMFRAVVFQSISGNKNVGLVFSSDSCKGFEDKVLRAPSYNINNVAVQTSAQCIDDGKRMDFPRTAAGRDYVVNEFKRKNSVTYEQDGIKVIFSANGFTKSYNEHGSNMGGL